MPKGAMKTILAFLVALALFWFCALAVYVIAVSIVNALG